jgi:hypothetical protein
MEKRDGKATRDTVIIREREIIRDTEIIREGKEARMSVIFERHREAECSLDIEEMARVRLQHSLYRAIRRVECDCDDGILRLWGRVPTFHYKQLAQTAVADLEGIREVINLIQVDNSP